MLRSNRTAILGLALLIGGLAVTGSACLVSLDESLIEDGKPASDAGTDAETSVPAEAGDAKSDTDNDAKEVGPDAGPDAEDGDSAPDGDAADEADAPDADDAPDTGDAMPDADAGDAGEGGDPFDGPLVECYDETWCPPTSCTLRTCDQGSCVNAGLMKEDVTSFNLPAALQCNQSANRTCAVAVRNYLVVLTGNGFEVFNTRNPKDVRQEYVPSNVGSGYSYLVRSGERVWALKNSSGGSTQLAWLDVPLDGVSPLSPPSIATVYVPALAARHAAPNDAIYLFHTESGPTGFVSRYAPGLPTTLSSYETDGAVELTAMASTGSRLLLQERVQHTTSPTTYRHHFSLQSDVLSVTSTNSGTYEETSLTNTSSTNGYYASSRTGAVAWVIGRYDSTPEWKDVRAYWLVADASAGVEPASVVLETFTTPPPSTPEGPLAFINNDTIATAVISGGTSPSSSLDIVRRQTGTPPQLIKRIPTSPLAAGALNVAGDSGYAYVITGQTVRMFAPSCAP
jgi:hypothetical protein